jgi:hypothetical protein
MRKLALPLRSKGGGTETYWVLDRLFWPGHDQHVVALKVQGDDEAMFTTLNEYEEHCLELTTGFARRKVMKLPESVEKLTIPIEEICVSEPESFIKGV